MLPDTTSIFSRQARKEKNQIMNENELSKILVDIFLKVHKSLGPGNKIIIEIKSVESLLPIHKKQLLTYLKLSRLKLGFLVNFNSEFIKNGIVRLVNGL